MMQIHPGVYFLRQTMIYQYLIVDQQNITLVDTGLKGNCTRIINFARNLGHLPQAIKQIIITHSDADHYGSANELRKNTNASLFASKIEAESMAEGKASRNLTPRGLEKVLYWFTGFVFRAPPTRVDKVLSPGETFSLLGGLEVLNTSGHTPGHISLFSKAEGVLFCGDSIDLMTGGIKASSGANTWNAVLAKQSFEFQMDLKPKLICAGHGYRKL